MERAPHLPGQVGEFDLVEIDVLCAQLVEVGVGSFGAALAVYKVHCGAKEPHHDADVQKLQV